MKHAARGPRSWASGGAASAGGDAVAVSRARPRAGRAPVPAGGPGPLPRDRHAARLQRPVGASTASPPRATPSGPSTSATRGYVALLRRQLRARAARRKSARRRGATFPRPPIARGMPMPPCAGWPHAPTSTPAASTLMGWSNGAIDGPARAAADAPGRDGGDATFRSAVAFYPGCADPGEGGLPADRPPPHPGGRGRRLDAGAALRGPGGEGARGRRSRSTSIPDAHHSFDRSGGGARAAGRAQPQPARRARRHGRARTPRRARRRSPGRPAGSRSRTADPVFHVEPG